MITRNCAFGLIDLAGRCVVAARYGETSDPELLAGVHTLPLSRHRQNPPVALL